MFRQEERIKVNISSPHLLLLIAVFFAGCSFFPATKQDLNPPQYVYHDVKNELSTLNFSEEQYFSESLKKYKQFYNLKFKGVSHLFGELDLNQHTVVVHVFIPRQAIGTLFLVHGFLDHSASQNKLIRESLSKGYAVVAYDLPGHGLSSGQATVVGSFESNARALEQLISTIEAHLPRPFHLVAHSTGAAITFEYLNIADNPVFEKIVFLAPLIRHKQWYWIKFLYPIFNPFVDRVRRVKRVNSSEPEYLAFVLSDPLQSHYLALDFIPEVYAWNKTISTYDIWRGKVKIIQGDLDSVVAWQYNLRFLDGKIQTTDITVIEGARHQLVNESMELRRQVFKSIFDYIESH